jgi:phage shock protein PspC (stress-responsive transcriptional regulator)
MNDETKPTEPLEPEPRPAPEPPRQRRLMRSRNDRMIAGVAGGLAQYFAVDPVIVRIGFAISVFFGGLGVLAYLALAIFVPAGDEGDGAGAAPIEHSRGLAIGAGIALGIIALSWGIFDGDWLWGDGWWIFPPALLLLVVVAFFANRRQAVTSTDEAAATQVQPTVPRSAGRTAIGIAAGIVLAFFAVGVLGAMAVASAWAGATGHGVAIAAAVIAIGALIAVSALRGQGARWLIVPAVALAVPLAAVSAADISFGDGIGGREYRPSSATALPDDGYELGIGQLLVDLRDLDWSQDTELDLDVDLGIGQAVVAVPENVCVSADIDATAGHLDVAGTDSDGWDPDIAEDVADASPPRLNLVGEVDLGEFLVVNDDDVDLDNLHGRWHDDRDDLESDGELKERMAAACATEPSSTTENPEPAKPDRGGTGKRPEDR